MYLLGIDIGSSSVKTSFIHSENGVVKASASFPKTEMKIDSPQLGWAEQNPQDWWSNLKSCLEEVKKESNFKSTEVLAIGISYQMHGLVCVDKNGEVLRPSIIWCDSRAAAIGDSAFLELGKEFCLAHYLNSPGNFTASKLRWVKENQPEIYQKIHKIMLPGDYIAMKLSGEITTTVSGLSEGIFWDFKDSSLAYSLLKHYEIEPALIPTIIPTFSNQLFTTDLAEEIGLKSGIPIS